MEATMVFLCFVVAVLVVAVACWLGWRHGQRVQVRRAREMLELEKRVRGAVNPIVICDDLVGLSSPAKTKEVMNFAKTLPEIMPGKMLVVSSDRCGLRRDEPSMN